MVASYIFAALFFDFPLTITQPWMFAISLLFTVLAFVSFGMIIAPIFVLNPGVQQWQNAMEFPVYILSGFLFPILLLPGWSTPLSYLLTPYWAARALHDASSGNAEPSEIAFSWLMMLLLSVVYFILSGVLFRVMLRRAREDASLGLH